MRRTTILLGIAVVLVAGTSPAIGQDMVRVRITNISKQIISPPLVASHTWKTQIFTPGNPASADLALLAEDGDPSGLAALLGGDSEVFDVAVAGGPLLPGETAVFDLEVRGRFNRISAVGMLVTTNDAFFGLRDYQIDRSAVVQHTTAPAYDAGTEFNNEMCGFIPGPPCGNPFVRDTMDAEGFIHVHPGIHGTGDLSPSAWDWQNPVVSIKVVR
jgi:hypothetical protein